MILDRCYYKYSTEIYEWLRNNVKYFITEQSFGYSHLYGLTEEEEDKLTEFLKRLECS